jgi:hypothetical protein
MFAELIGAAFGRGDIIAARPTTVFRTATRQVAGYARASLVLAVAIGVLATGLSFLVGRQIAAPTVVGAEVSTQEELDRLTAPMLREEFDALKEQAPTMAWFFERQDYEKVVALQGDKEIKENLRKAIERMRDLDPARAAELLGVTKRFLVMDLPEGAQAMAPAGTDIILIDAGHLRRITETGELVEGLILTVAHEADHIENKEKGLHAGMLGLREQAMEEERAYKETLRWLKLLGDTPEQVGMQEFVTNHIKDNGYTGIVARMVTVQPGVAVDRVVAIGNAVNVGVLSDKDEFLTADSATMDIKPTMTEDGRLMVMRLDAVSVVFMRNGILYKAYVTADGEQVIGTEIAPIMAEESIGRIKDADYALSVRRAYLESLIRQAQRDAEVKSLLEGLSRDLQTRMAGETDEGLKGELQRLIGIMSAAGVVVTPQIGKRVLVKRVFERRGKKYLEAESRDKKGKAISHEIPLEERDKEDLKKEVDASIKLADERFSPILRAFRNALDETDAPSLYVFSPLIGDLFGYASPADGLIAVHEHITDNPVAFIHEIGEYLINSGRLSLRYENGAMLVMVDGEQVGDSMLLGSDAIRQAEKNTESPHYLLRSLQREIFGESDVKLTDKIQIEQMAQTLDERLPKDAAAELGINSFDAAKSVRGFIKRGMTAGDMKTPIVVSYRDRTKDGKEVSFLLREGAPKVQPIKLDMEDIQDLHHNRYVGAEMNVLVGEAAPGKSSEEIEKFVELSKMAQSFISGLTRNKLVKELRRISGDDTIEFEDIGKDVYITDHLEGSSKHVFKIEFLAPEGEKTHTIAVATKTEKAKGDISAVEIRELQELQKRPEQVVPRFGADRRWNDKRWFTEEFIEGRTATGLDREGKLTVELKKKVVTALLSIATALGGLTPLDIHGGNFIVRDNGEVVMVDIGDRRFRLFGEAAANIEDEEPRMRHKLVFLATLMAQYGVYEAKKDRKGEPSFAGRPEDNYFIFDAILESKDLPEGEGMKLLREAYEYFRENHARDPDKFAEIFTDHKYMGGFRNVFYPMGISFSANVADMKAGLFPFSNLFMESLGSYLGEAERAPPAAPAEVEEALPVAAPSPPESVAGIGDAFILEPLLKKVRPDLAGDVQYTLETLRVGGETEKFSPDNFFAKLILYVQQCKKLSLDKARSGRRGEEIYIKNLAIFVVFKAPHAGSSDKYTEQEIENRLTIIKDYLKSAKPDGWLKKLRSERAIGLSEAEDWLRSVPKEALINPTSLLEILQKLDKICKSADSASSAAYLASRCIMIMRDTAAGKIPKRMYDEDNVQKTLTIRDDILSAGQEKAQIFQLKTHEEPFEHMPERTVSKTKVESSYLGTPEVRDMILGIISPAVPPLAGQAPPPAVQQLYPKLLSNLIDNADEMGWRGTETLLEHIKATPGLANPAAWEGVEQEIEIDENGNVVLYRYAEAEEAFTKSGEAVPVDKLRLTTDGFGEGEEGLLGVPTSFAPELLKGLGRYKGVYRIPVDDFIRLYGDKNLTLGNIGEREVVLSPDIAAKYLDTIQDLTAPAVETEPYKADRLVKGIVMEYGGEAVHMRGMRPDTRIIRSYLDALRARTATGDKVIPEVKKVYLPLTTLRKRTKIETKNEAELPAETIDLLRAANKEGLIELVELRTLNDYDEAADELEADREEFRNLLYDIQIPFMSEYAGRNAQTRLMDLADRKDEVAMKDLGAAVARALRTLHASKLHVGDPHLGQFTISGDLRTAYRVDLGDIKSFDDLAPDVAMRAVFEEYEWIEKNIEGISIAAAAAFRSEYPRETMRAVSGADVYAARGAIGDLRGDVVDWVVTPMAELADSAKSSIDSGARRKFSREYGTDTFTEGYTYKAGMSDEKLTENLKKTFAETLEKMSQPKYESKKPRAIVFVPADKYDLAKKALSDVLKEMGLEGLAARISVIKEANIADNGMVDEVMHVVSGKALQNYERFRKGDYPGEFGDAAKLRLANFLKTLVEDPAAIDLASDPDIINKILDGIAVLTMKRIDYEEIREWKSAQDEVLRSL